jgi:hypothetical protein
LFPLRIRADSKKHPIDARIGFDRCAKVSGFIDLLDMPELLKASPEMTFEYARWFVNLSAYVLQSATPHPGPHYYYRPRRRYGELPITPRDIQRHLAGEITLGIYAFNLRTRRVKWMAIDAVYRSALEDLLKLQFELGQNGIQAALEQSPGRTPMDLLRRAGAGETRARVQLAFGGVTVEKQAARTGVSVLRGMKAAEAAGNRTLHLIFFTARWAVELAPAVGPDWLQWCACS